MYDNNYIIGFVNIIKKKVTFKNTVHVILIPNIKDYIDENIFNDISPYITYTHLVPERASS